MTVGTNSNGHFYDTTLTTGGLLYSAASGVVTSSAALTGIVTGNGTGAPTANAVTQHGVLIGGASNAASSLGVAATGKVLTGVTGADPAFKSFSVNIQAFGTPGTTTYTPTAGMVYVFVECLGAGGGGGGALNATTGVTTSAGGGGGAGEYRIGTFSAATIGASQTVTIGTGGAANSGAAGGNGGNSTLGALIGSVGGGGGTTGAAGAITVGGAGSGGGGGSGGTFGANGQNGTVGIGMTTPLLNWTGAGANSQYGAGGFQVASGNSAGFAAGGWGSGGGGAIVETTGGGPLAGGAGAPGLIVITEYILS